MYSHKQSVLFVDDAVLLYEQYKHIASMLDVDFRFVHTMSCARTRIHATQYDCIVLDRVLPDGDGVELLDEISLCSPESRTLILSCKETQEEKIFGLKRGADDYLVKPFHEKELYLRIKSLLLKRKYMDLSPTMSHGVIVRDESCICEYNGKTLKLCKKEYLLFQFLLRHYGTMIKRETLYARLWTLDKYPTSAALDICIKRLREKLLGTGIIIETGRKVGYRLLIYDKNKTSHIYSKSGSSIS